MLTEWTEHSDGQREKKGGSVLERIVGLCNFLLLCLYPLTARLNGKSACVSMYVGCVCVRLVSAEIHTSHLWTSMQICNCVMECKLATWYEMQKYDFFVCLWFIITFIVNNDIAVLRQKYTLKNDLILGKIWTNPAIGLKM